MVVLSWCMVILTIASYSLKVECASNITSDGSKPLNASTEPTNVSTTAIQSTVTQNLATRPDEDSVSSVKISSNKTTEDYTSSNVTTKTANQSSMNQRKEHLREIVVITEDDDVDEKPGLRTHAHKKKIKRKGKAKYLLYKEFDADGKLLNNIKMRNLDDVANFFGGFLGTRICYGECIGSQDK